MVSLSSPPLFVYAAAVEAGPLAAHANTLALGVGKAAAAMSLTARLAVEPPSAVIAFGVAGAHRGGPQVGSLAVVDRDVLTDEGVMTPDGFLTLVDLGLVPTLAVEADVGLSARLAETLSVPRVSGSTVSTCSGTDALAEAAAGRSGAQLETMEGAAIGLVCQRFGVPWACVRAISNRTGDRTRADWQLEKAVTAVQNAVMQLRQVLT